MRISNRFVTERDKKVYQWTGFGRKGGFREKYLVYSSLISPMVLLEIRMSQSLGHK